MTGSRVSTLSKQSCEPTALCESQRDSVTQPRVGATRLPWVTFVKMFSTPKVVASISPPESTANHTKTQTEIPFAYLAYFAVCLPPPQLGCFHFPLAPSVVASFQRLLSAATALRLVLDCGGRAERRHRFRTHEMVDCLSTVVALKSAVAAAALPAQSKPRAYPGLRSQKSFQPRRYLFSPRLTPKESVPRV
jgi:hypothetical protein